MSSNSDNRDLFIPFSQNVEGIALPEKFTFPFYYEPHALSLLAVQDLQDFLENRAAAFGWDFWMADGESNLSRGRMFGVLVVERQDGTLGYLAAYSGNTTIPDKGFPFVPMIFDFWDETDFYRIGERELAVLSADIEALENNPEYIALQITIKEETASTEVELSRMQQELKLAKKERDAKRAEALLTLNPEDTELLKAELIKESLYQSYHFKKTRKNWKEELEIKMATLKTWQDRLDVLKLERKNLSNKLLNTIYKGFQFLNKDGLSKTLDELFIDTALKLPPSGAGECAAPRLLQYAFQQQLRPVTMAEFWWGDSSKSDIREHKYFYPACQGKCRPILGHMLSGIEMEINPMQHSQALDKTIEIIYEDDYLLVINKPEGLLSIPGRLVADSVYTRMLLLYPDATGPLVVHRLDMDTSGLMLVAKNMAMYKELQAQFIKRKVKKRYAALLEGLVVGEAGTIELPLMQDFINRPRQMVSLEEGKAALTDWKVLKRYENRTLVHFFPFTGRTHQLRVHAAHPEGLHCPIVGDDLYGSKDKRLFLHAEWIEFLHPIRKKRISFEKKAYFC